MDDTKASKMTPRGWSDSEIILKLHVRNTKDNSLIRKQTNQKKKKSLKHKSIRTKEGLVHLRAKYVPPLFSMQC